MTLTAPDRSDAGRQSPSGPVAKRRGRWWAVGLLTVVALVGLTVVVLRDGSDGPGSSPSPTTAAESTTTEAAGPGAVPTVDRSTAIWPLAGSQERFTEPVAAARSFATTYLGFASPAVGSFLAGDGRSGEVEIRPVADGPVTTVLVRQLSGADTWYVLGAVTANIEVAQPAALSTIRSPVTVRGSAHAFEGNVEVEVRQDGSTGAIGSGFVTGGGDQMRPFEGEVGFDPPTERFGALVFMTRSAENGQVWEASVLRVGLSGGDFQPATCGTYAPPRPLPASGEMEVTVHLTCVRRGAGEVVTMPAHRLVPRTVGVLEASLLALLAGPTADEADAGLQSWFSAATAGMVRSLNLVDGHAIVDFADLRPVIPNASASAGSLMLLQQLDATVFQFRSVETVEYRIDGSCEAFTEWLQIGGCDPRGRP